MLRDVERRKRYDASQRKLRLEMPRRRFMDSEKESRKLVGVREEDREEGSC